MGLFRTVVAHDFIQSAFADPDRAILGIEEMIWNGLDANASHVSVIFDENELGKLYQIRVVDDGDGMPYSDRKKSFGSLGGSRKRNKTRNASGREIHGQHGRGRFRAYAVGKQVAWTSTYREMSLLKRYSLIGNSERMEEFADTDPIEVNDGSQGMEVAISSLHPRAPKLREEQARIELGQKLSLYLTKYPSVEIIYDDLTLDLKEYQSRKEEMEIPIMFTDGTREVMELTIIEWNIGSNRSLFICDVSGMAQHESDPGIKPKNFNFTAYLKSEYLSLNGAFLSELDAKTKAILTTARTRLREYFRVREAQRADDLVKIWRSKQVYPYANQDAGPIEKAEREVFDICAQNVYEYLPGFQKLEQKTQKLTFGLIKEALKTDASSLRKILGEVLEMPDAQKEELAKLLEKTTLTSIINASKIVMDRLAFLQGMNELLYGTFKKSLYERTQLQRMLVQELWVFGEQYALGVDDESLSKLLRTHIEIIGRPALEDDSLEVVDLGGTRRIVDLMLYRRFPQGIPDRHEHLVVELKRPTVKLGQKEIGQIRNYAIKVSSDEQFDKKQTTWTFLLVGNSLDDYAEEECAQGDRSFGHIHSARSGALNIYVKTWASILADVQWRYDFFRQSLEYHATSEHGMEYLTRKHAEFLPPIKGEAET